MSLVPYRDQHAGSGLAQRDAFDLMPQAMELGKQLAGTDFVPKAFRNNPPAIMAAILTGQEIGLGPMASLAQIHVIEGKPTLSAEAMRALILSHGHELGFEEMTVTRCVMWGRRRGSQKVTTVTWTMDDARRAHLGTKQNWTNYPRAMLMARCTGELKRAIFADVGLGIPYVAEELEDGLIEHRPSEGSAPQAESTNGAGNGTEGTTRRRATRAATAPPPEPDLPTPEEVKQEPPSAPDPSEEPADEPSPEGGMTLSQQIAMVCREAGIERGDLIRAVTGKERGRDCTREEAQRVLEMGKAILRGEMALVPDDDRPDEWRVLPVGAEQIDLVGGDG